MVGSGFVEKNRITSATCYGTIYHLSLCVLGCDAIHDVCVFAVRCQHLMEFSVRLFRSFARFHHQFGLIHVYCAKCDGSVLTYEQNVLYYHVPHAIQPTCHTTNSPYESRTHQNKKWSESKPHIQFHGILKLFFAFSLLRWSRESPKVSVSLEAIITSRKPKNVSNVTSHFQARNFIESRRVRLTLQSSRRRHMRDGWSEWENNNYCHNLLRSNVETVEIMLFYDETCTK